MQKLEVRQEKIETIIAKRQPLIHKIKKVEDNLQKTYDALSNLDALRNRIIKDVDEEVRMQLKEINIELLKSNISKENENISKLKSRFSRDTLNIGVIGRARMGKSKLLQSLSGLSCEEIPDGNRTHCTGVRSIIFHNPNIETFAEVFFYTEQSFIDEVISPYYNELRLGSRPLTLLEFANNPLPPLPVDCSAYADPGSKYEHLVKYHKNIDKYRSLLSSPPKRITKGAIREYVSQITPEGKRTFFNYLAVREVKIICEFPHSDIGRIALVDMPGLGDTGIGDEERLIKTLGEDIDIVIFVRMPKPSGDFFADVDVRLYDTARSALVNLPINLWSFMTLNRTKAKSDNGDNYKNCEDLASTIQEKHINVVKCIIVDCSSPESVRNKYMTSFFLVTSHFICPPSSKVSNKIPKCY